MTDHVDIDLPQEVFVLVEDAEHAQEVMAKSDPVASERAEYIRACGGDVPEEHLPDVAVALDTAAAELRRKQRAQKALERGAAAAGFRNGVVFGNEANAKVGSIVLKQDGLWDIALSFDGQPVPLRGVRKLTLTLEVSQLPRLEVEYVPMEDKK